MTQTRRLTALELRLAGTLMEKEQITPDAYPMTLKALTSACNQKTNRDPVTDYREDEIRDGLEALRKDVLVWRSSGARVERWEHRLSSRWELDVAARAVLTLLMLRGPQTPGELRTRSERMTSFATVDAVRETLNAMSRGDHPLVRELPRAPGQSARRWCHLVGRDGEAADESQVAGDDVRRGIESEPSADATSLPDSVSVSPAAAIGRRLTALERAVEQLTRRLAELEDHVTGGASEGELQ